MIVYEEKDHLENAYFIQNVYRYSHKNMTKFVIKIEQFTMTSKLVCDDFIYNIQCSTV